MTVLGIVLGVLLAAGALFLLAAMGVLLTPLLGLVVGFVCVFGGIALVSLCV